ncbi:hypothetical protein F511_11242 [Dorcoceras hygrometricum]|uniref:Uncharacterized protein n=1 Tax=Dorcoceras hygrometricum TaxID=472368 RepID=A0A2Z7BUB4_9LAMI|nr:hypothetical protein F511_11242 [Dorcoceras hygrometricum]
MTSPETRRSGGRRRRRRHHEILARRKGARRRDKRAASARIMAQRASTIAAAAAHQVSHILAQRASAAGQQRAISRGAAQRSGHLARRSGEGGQRRLSAAHAQRCAPLARRLRRLPLAMHGQHAWFRSRMRARREGGGRRMRRRPVAVLRSFDVSILKFNKLDTIMAIHIDQIQKNLALIPLLGIRIRPPARQRKNKE